MSYADEIGRQARPVFVFARMSIKKRYSYANRVAYDGTRDYITLSDQSDVQSFAMTGTQQNDNNERNVFEFVGSIAAVVAPLQAYFDSANNRIIYYNFVPGIASLFTATVESSVYFSTSDIGWYQDPSDDSATMVKWTGAVVSAPAVTRSVAENFSGFSPVEITPLEIQWQNADMYSFFRETSFVNCLCDIWLCVGDLEPENVTKIFSGKIRGLAFDDSLVSFRLADYSYLLDATYNGFYCDSLGTGQFDPEDSGRAIPLVSGVVRWLKCTNQDYQSDPLATTVNRKWTVCDTTLGSAAKRFTVTTVTPDGLGGNVINCSAADNAKLFSDFYAKRVSDGTIRRLVRTGLGGGGWSLNPATIGDVWEIIPIYWYRFQVPSRMTAVVTWSPFDAIGYASCTDDGSTLSVVLSTSFEAAATALGLTNIDPSDFEVWVQVLGAGKDVQLSGTYLEDPDPSDVGSLAWYLKDVVGLADSAINAASFIAAKAARPYVLIGEQNRGGMLTPFRSTSFETHRDVVSALLQQIGAVGYFDGDGQFTIKARALLGTADWVLTESEIEPGTVKYEFYDSDIKAFNIDGGSPYIGTEVEFRVTKTPPVYAFRTRFSNYVNDPIGSPYGYTLLDLPVESVFSYDMCRIGNAYSVDTYLPAVKRMAKYFGNRVGRLSLTAYGAIIDALPGEIIEIQRDLLPGYSYVPGTTRTRKFFILEAQRRGDSIELLVEDQYSIEEAGGF